MLMPGSVRVTTSEIGNPTASAFLDGTGIRKRTAHVESAAMRYGRLSG
jgi:hypothetical protein